MNESTKERMNESMNQWMNEWTNQWLNEWMNKSINHWPTFCLWQYGSTFIQIFLVGPVKRFFPKSVFQPFKVIQFTDFGTNRKCLCDFLLVCYSNLGPILHCFGNIAVFCAHDPIPIPPQFWGSSCWTRLPILGSAHALTLSYPVVKLFSTYSNLCDHGTWTSQTDGWTDDILWACITWQKGKLMRINQAKKKQ